LYSANDAAASAVTVFSHVAVTGSGVGVGVGVRVGELVLVGSVTGDPAPAHAAVVAARASTAAASRDLIDDIVPPQRTAIVVPRP